MSTPDWRVALTDIPGLACVAFAARCARRVQPLFLVSWPQAPQRLYQLVDGAIETVEESIQGIDRTTSTFAFNAMSAVKAASKANAKQAAVVASTAACATQSLTAVGYGTFSATHAAQAADYAIESVQFGPAPEQAESLKALVSVMQLDLERIREGLTNGTIKHDEPVPAGYLGPIWPDGEPESMAPLLGSL